MCRSTCTPRVKPACVLWWSLLLLLLLFQQIFRFTSHMPASSPDRIQFYGQTSAVFNSYYTLLVQLTQSLLLLFGWLRRQGHMNGERAREREQKRNFIFKLTIGSFRDVGVWCGVLCVYWALCWWCLAVGRVHKHIPRLHYPLQCKWSLIFILLKISLSSGASERIHIGPAVSS